MPRRAVFVGTTTAIQFSAKITSRDVLRGKMTIAIKIVRIEATLLITLQLTKPNQTVKSLRKTALIC